MKVIYIFIALSLLACNENVQNTKTSNISDSAEHKIDPVYKVRDESKLVLQYQLTVIPIRDSEKFLLKKMGSILYKVRVKYSKQILDG